MIKKMFWVEKRTRIGARRKSIAELASELKITTRAISTYKARNGCAGILDALVQMQREKREKHIIDGKAVSYEEMRKMGYSKYKCGKVPNRSFLYTRSLWDMTLSQIV